MYLVIATTDFNDISTGPQNRLVIIELTLHRITELQSG